MVTVLNPEEGWDDDTDPSGVVVDYTSKEEVSRRRLFLLFSSGLKVELLYRYCIHGKDGHTESSSKQRLVFSEGVWRWRVHRCWTTYHSAEREETK